MTSSSISLLGSWDTTRSKALADLINRSLRQSSGSHKTGDEPNQNARPHQTTHESGKSLDIQSW